MPPRASGSALASCSACGGGGEAAPGCNDSWTGLVTLSKPLLGRPRSAGPSVAGCRTCAASPTAPLSNPPLEKGDMVGRGALAEGRRLGRGLAVPVPLWKTLKGEGGSHVGSGALAAGCAGRGGKAPSVAAAAGPSGTQTVAGAGTEEAECSRGVGPCGAIPARAAGSRPASGAGAAGPSAPSAAASGPPPPTQPPITQLLGCPHMLGLTGRLGRESTIVSCPGSRGVRSWRVYSICREPQRHQGRCEGGPASVRSHQAPSLSRSRAGGRPSPGAREGTANLGSFLVAETGQGVRRVWTGRRTPQIADESRHASCTVCPNLAGPADAPRQVEEGLERRLEQRRASAVVGAGGGGVDDGTGDSRHDRRSVPAPCMQQLATFPDWYGWQLTMWPAPTDRLCCGGRTFLFEAGGHAPPRGGLVASVRDRPGAQQSRLA